MPKRIAQRGVIVPKFPVRSGRHYSYRTFFGGFNTTNTLVANTLYATPFAVNMPLTVNAIHLDVTTGVAASHLRLGVYSALGGNGDPDALLAAGTEIDSAATAQKSAAISLAFVPGILYYLVALSDAALVVRSLQGGTSHFGAVNSSDTQHRALLSRSFTYAALPATWGAVGTVDLNPLFISVVAV